MSDHHANLEAQARYIRADIMTADQRAQARSDRESSSQAAWNSAFMSLELQAEIGDELSVTAIRMAVGAEYHVSDETIPSRERAAVLFHGPHAHRRGVIAAHPDLTFSYWRTAADARHLADPFESMLDIIAQIEAHLEHYGELPSVRTVESWVASRDDRAALVWRSRSEGVVTQLEKIKCDRYAPADYRNLAGYCQVLIQSYLETGISPLKSSA